MAEDKKKRKSSRHFNLEKPVERFFEIEKDVDLIDVAPNKPGTSKSPLVAPIAPVKGPENVKKPSDTIKVDAVKNTEGATTHKPDADGSNMPEPKEKSSKWKWLIPAAIVAAAVPSYFLFTGNDDTPPPDDQIVATAPEAGQNNSGGDATIPNAPAGGSDNSEDVAGSDGSGDIGNVGESENPNGSENLGSGDNPSEGNAGNASSPGTGNVVSSSSGSGNIGQTSSGAKVSTPQSSDIQSSPNNKATSVSSTASAGSSNVRAVKTETSSRRGTTESGTPKKSSTSGNPVISGSIEQKAFDVIRGIYGNGQVRKDKLGAEYAEIQKLVNEMYRNGTIKR